MPQYLSFSLVMSSISGIRELAAVLHHRRLCGLGIIALSVGVARVV